jgi:hypothetical protein
MKRRLGSLATAIFWLCSFALAEPRVLVLPFDPIMDSLYAPLGGKESVLSYREALQQLISSDLAKDTTIQVVDRSEFMDYVKSNGIKTSTWNDVKLAAKLASYLRADYAIIGTYGEFTNQIRVDARVIVAAIADIPQGYTITGTANLWEDMPTAAEQVSQGVLRILTQSGIIRPVSKGYLFPEGDLTAFDPNGTHAANAARVVVWVNTPSPKITASPTAVFARCSRIDRMNMPAEEQTARSCYSADVTTGTVHLNIQQRGYLPFEDDLNVAPGKAYRLMVNLQPIERLPR